MRQNAEKALSDESFRKKVKRLTGELDMLSTYTSSLHKLFTEALPRTAPESVSQDLSRVMKSTIESIQYMQNLCCESGLGVTQGKRV